MPCVACETQQRASQIMIPAATLCPSDDWILEYKGYLMTSATHVGSNDDSVIIKGKHSRDSYVCVDGKAEAIPSPAVGDWIEGVTLYAVSASCTGPGALKNCPHTKVIQLHCHVLFAPNKNISLNQTPTLFIQAREN